MKYKISKALIIAGGEKPTKRSVLKLLQAGFRTTICADGGYLHTKRMGLIPDFIIGDFDSVGELSGIQKECKLVQIKRQTDTDVEKCIKFAVRSRAEELVILGGIGDRLDHSIANIGLIAKYSDKLKISLFHGRTYCTVLTGKRHLNSRKGEVVSLYGLSKDTIVTTSGLKYELKNGNIYLGGNESTSNIALRNELIIDVRDGKALVIRELNSYFL